MARSTADDLATFFDIGDIRELANVEEDASQKAALQSAKVTKALSAASGQILAALRQGDHYRPDDIDALSGDSLEYYKQMECLIAMAILYRSKPHYQPEIAKALQDQAESFLDKLRRGVNVLNIEVNIKAGVPDAVLMPEPTVFNLQKNTIATKLTGTVFPHRRS